MSNRVFNEIKRNWVVVRISNQFQPQLIYKLKWYCVFFILVCPLHCWRCSSDNPNAAYCDDPFDASNITDQQRRWGYVDCEWPHNALKPYSATDQKERGVCKKVIQLCMFFYLFSKSKQIPIKNYGVFQMEVDALLVERAPGKPLIRPKAAVWVIFNGLISNFATLVLTPTAAMPFWNQTMVIYRDTRINSITTNLKFCVNQSELVHWHWFIWSFM